MVTHDTYSYDLLASLGSGDPQFIHSYGATLTTKQWIKLVQEAKMQQVDMLLHQQLLAGPAFYQTLPKRVQKSLNLWRHQSVLNSLQLYAELIHLLRSFHQEGIPVIGLKGVHLAQYIYSNRILRPMRDIDLLVKPQHLDEADRLLHHLGYRMNGDKQKYRERHFHFNYQPTEKKYAVEIHWDIQKKRSPFQVNLNDWWSRTETKSLANVPFTVLSPEDLFIHLCLHLVKHHGQDGFRPLIDIAQLINHPDKLIDWPRLTTIVQTQKLNKPIYLTLALMADLLSISPPSFVTESLHDPKLTTEAYNWFRQQIITRRGQHTPPQISPLFAKISGTHNILTKTKLVYQALQAPPDGGLDSNQKTPQPSLIRRLSSYSQHLGHLFWPDSTHKAEIQAMHWLSTH